MREVALLEHINIFVQIEELITNSADLDTPLCILVKKNIR